MATPPKLKRVTIEELSSLESPVRKGIGKLLGVLNPFLSSVTSALDHRLTLSENSAAVIKELRFTMPDTKVPLILTGYGTAEWSDPSISLRAKRTGNRVNIQGFLQHRSTNLADLTNPIFKIPSGYTPDRTFIEAAAYKYEPATMYFQASTGIVYLPYALNTTPSEHIDVSVDYTTADALPDHPAPFPLNVDVSNLTTKPTLCTVMKIEDLTSRNNLSVKPDLVWTVENVQGKNTVKIKRVDGLIEGHEYRMLVICTS